jgi:hypothetical protein
MRFGVSRWVRRGLLAVSLATPAFATDLNWPQFRGPEGQGVTRETGIALEWTDTKNVLWKTELPGRGHSSWTARSSSIPTGSGRTASTRPRSSPTPVTDGKRVYAYFGSEGLYASDFDGTLDWEFVPGVVATMGVGVGTSPLLYKDLVILLCDEDNGDKRSSRWRCARAAPAT